MRLLRHRWLALPCLAVYLVAALALPMAHLAHHKNDHVHGPGGEIIPLAGTDDFHQAFDADLAAIDLTEAGHLGIASVDCELARYTLAVCDDPGAPPHTFGDELAARSPHHHHPREGRSARGPIDPAHGAGSLAHFGIALLATPPFLLPPPTLPIERTNPSVTSERSGVSPPLALRARAPPLSPV